MADDKQEGAQQKQQQYEKDWPGLPIKHLVLACTDYIVFIDNDNDVDWETTDQFEAELDKDPGDFYTIISKAAMVESAPCDYISESALLSFKRLIAESIARALSRDFANAKSMLDEAKTFLLQRNMEKSRLWLLASSGISAGIIALVAFGFWLFRAGITNLTGIMTFNIFMGVCAGAIGAYLSVVARTGHVHLDCNAGRTLFYVEGISRIFAGMVSALILMLAALNGLLLSTLMNGQSQHSSLLLIGLVAGASERLAPSFIEKFHTIALDNEETHAAADLKTTPKQKEAK